jgi:hypothetical protein
MTDGNYIERWDSWHTLYSSMVREFGNVMAVLQTSVAVNSKSREQDRHR